VTDALTVAELQRRAEEILAPVAHPRALAALALVEEAGEVARLVLEREGYGKPLDRAKLGGELADLIVAAAEVATRNGVDLDRACREKLEDLARRAPKWAAELGPALADARARMDSGP
jgi:NTP pyrophosphatase (non-canonical NTP hydrolase)